MVIVVYELVYNILCYCEWLDVVKISWGIIVEFGCNGWLICWIEDDVDCFGVYLFVNVGYDL